MVEMARQVKRRAGCWLVKLERPLVKVNHINLADVAVKLVDINPNGICVAVFVPDFDFVESLAGVAVCVNGEVDF